MISDSPLQEPCWNSRCERDLCVQLLTEARAKYKETKAKKLRKVSPTNIYHKAPRKLLKSHV